MEIAAEEIEQEMVVDSIPSKVRVAGGPVPADRERADQSSVGAKSLKIEYPAASCPFSITKESHIR